MNEERRPAPRPRDAATIILSRQSRHGPEVLMGRRPAKHVFMAGVYVFPGGRVDRADARARTADELHPKIAARLGKSCTPVRARALGIAAIRELYEEAGLMLGTQAEGSLSPGGPSPTWQRAFAEAGIAPPALLNDPGARQACRHRFRRRPP